MRRLTHHLYFLVLLAILTGGTIGYASPATGVALKPLGDGFIALVKMLISPIIFCTVVLGIAGAGDMKKVGRVGGKALLYFEVVSTFALVIGLVVANLVRPGAGFNADPASLDAGAVDVVVAHGGLEFAGGRRSDGLEMPDAARSHSLEVAGERPEDEVAQVGQEPDDLVQLAAGELRRAVVDPHPETVLDPLQVQLRRSGRDARQHR